MSCSICFERADPKVNLSCGHEFHHSCLATWLTKNDSCPMCRKNLTGAESQENKDEDDDYIPTVLIVSDNGFNISSFELDALYYNLDELITYDEQGVLKWDKYDYLQSIKLNFKFGAKRQKKILGCNIYKYEDTNKITYITHVEFIKFWRYQTKQLKVPQLKHYQRKPNYLFRK